MTDYIAQLRQYHGFTDSHVTSDLEAIETLLYQAKAVPVWHAVEATVYLVSTPEADAHFELARSGDAWAFYETNLG
jgi:hypothetical protein